MDKQTQKELLEIVGRNYDEIADDFNESRKKYLWPELIKLTRAVKDGDKILDVGCGNARLLEAFLGKKIEYLGLDKSRKLIDIARKNYPDDKFTVGNILELSQVPQFDFDYIFCVAVLHHLPGRNLRIDALRQLRSKIKEDGRIILVVWNLWAQPKYRKLIRKFFLLKLIKKNKMDFGDIVFSGFNQRSKRYYHAFRKRELKKLCRKAGLKIEKIYKDKFNYYLILKK